MSGNKRYAATPIKRLTLEQLLRFTPPEIIDRARKQCHVLRKEYAVGSRDQFNRTKRKDKAVYNEFRVYSQCLDGKRASYIRFFGPPGKKTPVWVWCSCEYYTYNLEVCLTYYNSSGVKLSNGALPVKRNPDMTPHLCKHLVNAARMSLQLKNDLAAESLKQNEGEEAVATTAAAQQAQKMRSAGKRIPANQFVAPPRSPGLIDLP